MGALRRAALSPESRERIALSPNQRPRHLSTHSGDRFDDDLPGELPAEADPRLPDHTDARGTGLEAAHYRVLVKTQFSQAMAQLRQRLKTEHPNRTARLDCVERDHLDDCHPFRGAPVGATAVLMRKVYKASGHWSTLAALAI